MEAERPTGEEEGHDKMGTGGDACKVHEEAGAEEAGEDDGGIAGKKSGSLAPSLLALHPSGSTVFATAGAAIRGFNISLGSAVSFKSSYGAEQAVSHGDAVRAMCVDPTGRVMATAGDDKIVNLWVREEQSVSNSWICCHKEKVSKRVSAMGYSSDGRWLLFADKFGVVHALAVPSPTDLAAQNGEGGEGKRAVETAKQLLGHCCSIITCLAVSHGNRFIATGDRDGKIRVATSLSFAPDGKIWTVAGAAESLPSEDSVVTPEAEAAAAATAARIALGAVARVLVLGVAPAAAHPAEGSAGNASGSLGGETEGASVDMKYEVLGDGEVPGGKDLLAALQGSVSGDVAAVAREAAKGAVDGLPPPTGSCIPLLPAAFCSPRFPSLPPSSFPPLPESTDGTGGEQSILASNLRRFTYKELQAATNRLLHPLPFLLHAAPLSLAALPDSTDGTGGEQSILASNLRRFTYKELQAATNRFRDESVLGAGSFGKVYRGAMEEWLGELPKGEKRPLAVKMLDEESFQGFGEWMVRGGGGGSVSCGHFFHS
ncbi:unnamed protein product [Closterium sp. NIES-53]